LTGLQGTLLDGVHLPDLMHAGGPSPLRGGLASGRRRRELPLLKVSLQGAFTGQIGPLRLLATQFHQDIGRAPSGMEFMQVQGLQQGGPRRGCWGRMVAGRQRRRAPRAELLTESPNRSRREPKLRRDVRRQAAELETGHDLSPQGKRKRRRHGDFSLKDLARRDAVKHNKWLRSAAKPVGGICGQTYWRVTDGPVAGAPGLCHSGPR
jgi:hypothetical protein